MAFPGLGQYSTFGYPNVFIPGYMGDGEAQKRFIVGYTLDEDAFALNQYTTVVGADKPIFYYMKWNSQDFVRVPHATGLDLQWHDGTDRPSAQENPRFTNILVELQRYGDHTFIGEMTEEFSDIGSMIPIIQESFATQFMVRRAIAVQTALTTAANYPSDGTTHQYTKYGILATNASTLGYSASYFGTAGTDNIYNGTLDDPFIKKTIAHAVRLILLRSNGRVKASDLCIVISPWTAARLAATKEIRSYNAQSPVSIDYTKGTGDFPAASFGLPNPLYGLKVIIEGTTKNTAKQDHVNADVQSFVMANDQLTIMARPGSVSGMAGSSAYSSVVVFQHKKWAMKPETFVDPENHRTKVAFSDFFAVEMTAPELTFSIDDISNVATS